MAITRPMGSPPSGMDKLPVKQKDDLGGSAGASQTVSPFEHAEKLKPVSTEVTGDAGASKIESPFQKSLKTPKRG